MVLVGRNSFYPIDGIDAAASKKIKQDIILCAVKF